MCGICGEWNLLGADAAALERMNAALVHRGPDDHGAVVLGETGLAMRRLSIIDLPRGHQPIANEDRSAWVVFNGEIYNHRELRRDLLRRGHTFRTDSDTEVILHLYEERGERCVEELRGMFAFALWNARRRRLLLARDRFGQKPLFYRFDGRRLLFASEIKAILAAGAAGGSGAPRPELDLRSLDEYLTLRFIPSPRTLFQGIRKLPPAHLLVLDASDVEPPTGALAAAPTIEVRRYWQLRYFPKRGYREPELVEEARERVREAVDSHLISDVPVGAYLSGGMDSSLVVALMSELREDPVSTFAVGVDDAGFNELPWAAQVARHCHTRHYEEVVWPDMVELLPSMVHHLDEPSDPIAACMYHAAGLASRHVKVVLTGDGGDEVFAGYDRYFGFRWVGLYAALPEAVRRLLLGPALHSLRDSSAYKNLTQKARWMHDLSFHEGGRRYAQATAFFRFGHEGKGGLYAPDVAAELAEMDPMECVVRGFEEAEARDDLDRMLQADVATRLPEHSLMLSDRMTMAHGLEARSPLLDHRLAEFVATLPAHLKMRGRRLKYLLRRVAAPYLPASILERPKQGFMFPLAYWMKGPLLPVLRHLLSTSVLIEEGIFRREPVERLVAEHVAGRADHHVRLWMILNVEVWYRMYVRGEPRENLAGLLRERLGSAA
ncbi:MAG TPA: asparagine synthase (glutamine-hydrolyzing) [Thermoanaerobaculia bacterium]|jgi:asparagine synthase (glutamine-hydrolysing)|nr:asparagine synthase (glutamine-hydrolyzing) [Thermoanaerobaculia bacterium]